MSAAWQHKAVPHKRCFLTDCFGATTRKTQNKNNIYSTGGENIFVRSPTFPLLQFPYWSVEEGGGGTFVFYHRNGAVQQTWSCVVCVCAAAGGCVDLFSPSQKSPKFFSDGGPWYLCNTSTDVAPTFPPLCLSLAFARSIFCVSSYSVLVTHFLPLYQKLTPRAGEVTIKVAEAW